MKKFIATWLVIFFLSPTFLMAGSAVFHYDDFGPQVAVYELIGFQWWQWESQGDPDPTSKPDIRVIVYWDEALDDIKAQYPVDQQKKLDYRYIEYDNAKKHLENLIAEFEQSELNTDSLHATLHKINKIKMLDSPADCN